MDLDALSLDELKKLRKDVETAIRNYEDRKKKAALAELEAKAAEFGFSLSDLTGGASRTRKVNPPKFRNPEDATQTWSGRGRQPDWFKELVSAGTNPDDLLIVKAG
jgi:DNA-binding protein H-NS